MTEALAFVAGASALAGLVTALPGRRRSAGRSRRRQASVVAVGTLALAGGLLRGGRRTAAPRDLAARIVAAGRPGGFGPREVMAAKVGAVLAGGAFGALLAPAAPGRLGAVVAAACPLAGFFAPDLWLRRRARERFRAARRELPGLLDLLRVTVEAGLPLAAALGSVGARSSGPLGAEWRAVAGQTELGVPLARALAGMAARLPVAEVEALAAALERAARHGTPVADALAAMARDARLAERRRVQEDAARAGPKIQLVVALLLVPSVLLLVAAALAAALLGPGGEVALS